MSSHTRQYEALFVLDTRGKEEGNKETIERLEKEINAEGAKVLQVQRLEKRELAYEHRHLKSAYYVNFVIEAAPALIERLRQKFKLDEEIALQQYSILQQRKNKAPAS
jgi:ribosomal protein S6